MKMSKMLVGQVVAAYVVAAGFAIGAGDAGKERKNQTVVSDQQKLLDQMKAKGTEASLTVLPVGFGDKDSGSGNAEMQNFRDRVTEVVGMLMEQKGLKDIELGRTAFDPGAGFDMADWTGPLGEFLKRHPVTTEYVLYSDLRTNALSAIVADKTGAVVWSGRLTDKDKAFKDGPPDPLVACIMLTDMVGPQFGLNEQTRKVSKPGKMAALMAERSGHPPEKETAALAGRQAEMKKAMPKATLLVFSPRARAAEAAAEAGNAADLAKLINDAGLCKAKAAGESLLLNASQAEANEAKVLWDLAREFRDYVKTNPTDADYVLYADYRFNPDRREAGFVHLIACDRHGEWVIADLQNSHHPDYQNVKPTSKKDCDKILVKRLKGYLK